MAQHDYVIDNQSFPATRTDINNALLAISSTNSGTSAPSTTYASQLWYDTTNNKLYIRNEDNDAWIPLFLLDQSNDVAGTLATQIDVEDASGTNAAGTALTVKGGAGTGSGAGGSIIFQTADGGSSGSSVNAHATRVTITDDGNVGIGRSPNYKLDAYINGTGSPAIASANDFIVTAMQSVGSSQGNIGTLTSHPLVFTSGNTERMRILAGGGLTFNGDTAAANALDDYEEGTFTATLTADSVAPNTPPTATFSYTKIGRLVHINGAFSSANVTGASGAIRITGLPFAISSARASGDVMFNFLADVGTVAFNAAVYVTGSDIVFYASNDAGSWAAIQINAGTGRDVILSATYQTG